MNAIRRLFPALPAMTLFGLTGCATTQDIERQGQRLDRRIDSLGAAVQHMNDSQQALGQQIRQLEAGLGARLGKLEADLRQLNQQYRMLESKVEANHDEFIKSRLEGKLIKQLFLTEDHLLYPADAPDIPPQDAKVLDSLARELKHSDSVYHIEIQGHTDDSGMPDFNRALGEGRAKAVRDYLYRYGGIPLYRMSTISFGALVPAAEDPGATANRRVKLLIYR